MARHYRWKRPAESDGTMIIVTISLLVLIVSAIRASHQSPQEEVEQAARALADGTQVSLALGGQVEDARIAKFTSQDYEEVREGLGLSHDFCVYFEDGEGNVIPIDGVSEGIGSPDILINQRPCSWE